MSYIIGLKVKDGKTAAAYVAISVWGTPENLKVNFDATLVGIEGLSKIFVDLPILVDEKMIDKNQQKVEKMVYGIASGKTKLRGTTNGSVQATAIWRCITLSTGEEPLSNNKSQDGVRSRIIELYGKTFEDEAEAYKMYQFTQEHCGTAGKFYINYLIQKYGKDNYKKLKVKLEEIKVRLKARCPNINFAQLSYIALVTLADILIGDIFYRTTEESSYEMAEKVVENISKSISKDLVDHAYSDIGDWILSNESRFDKVEFKKANYYSDEAIEVHSETSSLNVEKYGVYNEEIFYIWPSKFEAVIENAGFNSEKVKQGFKERNYIVSDNDSLTTKVFYNGCERELIGIKLKSETVHSIDDLHENGLATELENTESQMPTIEDLGIQNKFEF